MSAIDTGICAPESIETLLLQQWQLKVGRRHVQMFPAGTAELPLPPGLSLHINRRGVFHYDASAISVGAIELLSALGRENEFLMLGPFSKADIAKRAMAGEKVTCIAEYSPDGVEIRCAAGTEGTIAEQRAYFESTKEPGSRIVVGELPERVRTAFCMKG